VSAKVKATWRKSKSYRQFQLLVYACRGDGNWEVGNTYLIFKINKKEHASPINSGLISMRGVLNIKNV
jgi:hypothetical protein